MSHIPTQNTVIVPSKEWRLKTDEEIEEMTFRPWICGCGDVVDDKKPRKCKWLYMPWCRNPRLDDNKDEEKTETITEGNPSSTV